MEEKKNHKIKEAGKNVKEKGIVLIFRILFSRTMITLLLLLVQIAFIMAVIRKMWLSPGVLVASYLIGAIAVVYIVNSDSNPAFKLSWIVPICALPVFGVSFYILILLNPGNRDLKKLLDRRIDETRGLLYTSHRVQKKLLLEEDEIKNIATYIEKENYFPTYDHTEVAFLSLGEEKLERLLVDLKEAKHYIFLEYFIINKGVVWDQVLEILEMKAKEGVEIRVMYDGMCALTAMPFSYPKKLKELGIKAKMFSPIRPLLSTHQNSRDHRKIVVIDGKIAYNGGINLADEYMNEKQKFGHWKDTAVRLEGEAVRSFVIMFLQLWNITEKGAGEYENYLVSYPDVTKQIERQEDKGYVIPYNDDPINRRDIAEDVYLNLIHCAKRYVHIMTPYFILDHELESALCFAARRGVEVKIILPHIPDKKIPFSIARTYYPQMIEAGVQIYEYTPGFVHAKEVIVDDQKAVVGSINFDFRSLFQHFECATFLYRKAVINEIEADYQKTLKKCLHVDLSYYVDLPFYYRIAGSVFRLFGPLM